MIAAPVPGLELREAAFGSVLGVVAHVLGVFLVLVVAVGVPCVLLAYAKHGAWDFWWHVQFFRRWPFVRVWTTASEESEGEEVPTDA